MIGDRTYLGKFFGSRVAGTAPPVRHRGRRPHVHSTDLISSRLGILKPSSGPRPPEMPIVYCCWEGWRRTVGDAAGTVVEEAEER